VTYKSSVKNGECSWNFVEVPGAPNKFCGKPTGFKVIKDEESGNISGTRREYNSFCPEHQKLVDQEENQ